MQKLKMKIKHPIKTPSAQTPPPTAISDDFSDEPKKKKKDPATGSGRDPPQRPGERDPATPNSHFCLSGKRPKKKR
jgi:hypothetical protein